MASVISANEIEGTRNLSQCDKCPQRHNFPELMSKVKVNATVTQGQYATLRYPKPRYIHTPNFGSLPHMLQT